MKGGQETEGVGQPVEVWGTVEQEVLRLELHVFRLMPEMDWTLVAGVERQRAAGGQLGEQLDQGVQLGVREVEVLGAVTQPQATLDGEDAERWAENEREWINHGIRQRRKRGPHPRLPCTDRSRLLLPGHTDDRTPGTGEGAGRGSYLSLKAQGEVGPAEVGGGGFVQANELEGLAVSDDPVADREVDFGEDLVGVCREEQEVGCGGGVVIEGVRGAENGLREGVALTDDVCDEGPGDGATRAQNAEREVAHGSGGARCGAGRGVVKTGTC
ncbi:hypothetical protein DGo_PC0105 (plasmid) [Deinococcus gobiensis I-0]|uniref:Uncharacterized protein n=1 Tax=Deinococcus gobiensis (strain DSM 21396 / JCM 16679 / CGMCC 1.7299 / I-0) TaxID=745776 RepID=H8H300_DEIGI|nr:hypothetical protein DGo_PC0105 [Deinococcus gobiensis I-0]